MHQPSAKTCRRAQGKCTRRHRRGHTEGPGKQRASKITDIASDLRFRMHWGHAPEPNVYTRAWGPWRLNLPPGGFGTFPHNPSLEAEIWNRNKAASQPCLDSTPVQAITELCGHGPAPDKEASFPPPPSRLSAQSNSQKVPSPSERMRIHKPRTQM